MQQSPFGNVRNNMTLGKTFREWLDESNNNEDDKDLYVEYIKRLGENLETGFPGNRTIPDWKKLLSLVYERLGETEVDENYVFLKLHYLSSVVDDFKKDEPKYFAVFGDNFGRRSKQTRKISVYHSVGDCKTALDQYTRYLRRVPGELARHADRVRDHYDKHLEQAKAAKKNPLTLDNEWKVMKNLAEDPQSTVSAMLVESYRTKHNIEDIEHRRNQFIVHFCTEK